jgi:putative endonuclease
VKGDGVDRLALGAQGEELAVDFLRRQRYVIVERNYRCRGGELDIVARDGKTLVFVEVKTRRTEAFGVPQLAVTPFKQRQISKAALTWLARNRQMDCVARFDVIAIRLHDNAPPAIEQIKNAFELAY